MGQLSRQPEDSSKALLSIRELAMAYPGVGARTLVLTKVDLQLRQRESVGICGESGCGKTTLARAIVGLQRPLRGCVEIAGENVYAMTPRRLRQVRGGVVSLAPQEPSMALNPVAAVEAQVMEVIQAHRPGGWAAARAQSKEWLEMFFGPDFSAIARRYPHELSGGQRQRVVLAQALSCSPSLLIADEPTSSLDSIAQRQFLDALIELREQFGLALLMLSHDRRVLSYVCDRVLRLEGGELVD